MIKIECDDSFLRKNIINLLKQKKFFSKDEYSNKFFFQLKIYQQEDCLFCQVEDDQIKFNLPRNFEEIFEKIFDLVSNKNIHVSIFHYYPFKQSIRINEKITLLTEIQNKIITHLLLNLDNGIEKVQLIKNIWPKDKDIFLNKLDTHLTNLKNQISNELGFDLNFSSKSGILKLCID